MPDFFAECLKVVFDVKNRNPIVKFPEIMFTVMLIYSDFLKQLKFRNLLINSEKSSPPTFLDNPILDTPNN